jgi:hypothetical protein
MYAITPQHSVDRYSDVDDVYDAALVQRVAHGRNSQCLIGLFIGRCMYPRIGKYRNRC